MGRIRCDGATVSRCAFLLWRPPPLAPVRAGAAECPLDLVEVAVPMACAIDESLPRLAAVNHHRGSGDEGSRIRTQPQDGCGDLLRLAGPADWLRRSRARDLPLLPLRGAPAEAIHHWRVDDAGAHDIDADVRRGVVEGRRLSQADHTVFRRDVRRLILEALDPGARGGVHDCAALLEYQRNLVLHAQEH